MSTANRLPTVATAGSRGVAWLGFGTNRLIGERFQPAQRKADYGCAVPLDPIVSLSVAIAESPGAIACLLGAGVSVDAGVPTGWSIYRDGVRRLYRLENATEETPGDDELDGWLAATGRADLGYSSLLDLIAPDPATRRALVAGYFAEAQPGTTHNLLADLAARGLVRVFVTTNFDRLLEAALQAHGLEPVVVSNDATLNAAPRREHAPVFIVKAHGDYLQETIRNTPSELAELEPALTAELHSIFNHYGVLVMGWSGSDAGLVELFRARQSRYGVWWLTLGDPPEEPGRSVAEAAGARIIIRDGAGVLLSDLDRRLSVYETYTGGDDPGSVHDEMRNLLRGGDDIGLDELLRRERFAYEAALEGVARDHFQHFNDPEHVRDASSRILAASQRRLASLILLARHRPEDLAAAISDHAGWASSRTLVGGGLTWQRPWIFSFWLLGMVLGGLVVRLERFGALPALLQASWTDNNNHRQPFVGVPGETGILIIETLSPPAQGRADAVHEWRWLVNEISSWSWMAERYPDWLQRDGEPGASLAAFELLDGLATALRHGGQVFAWWTVEREVVTRFVQRLHNDERLRGDVAAAIGTTLADFDERAPEIIAASQGVGMFPRLREVANILRTGSFS